MQAAGLDWFSVGQGASSHGTSCLLQHRQKATVGTASHSMLQSYARPLQHWQAQSQPAPILCTQSYAHCWYSVSPMLQSYARPLQHRQQMRAAVAATGYSGEVEFVPLSQVFSNEASEGDVSHQHQQQLDRLCSLVQVRFICFLKGGEWMRICVCT